MTRIAVIGNAGRGKSVIQSVAVSTRKCVHECCNLRPMSDSPIVSPSAVAQGIVGMESQRYSRRLIHVIRT